MSLLSKGLKFSPTPTDSDKAKLKEDLEAYKRRMRLRWHFRNNTDSDSQDASDNNSNTFRIKSMWQPPKDDPVLENYLSPLEKEVLSVSPEGKNFSTVETRIKEPVFIRTLRLKFHLLNPLNKNPKEAETGTGSYIKGFMLFFLKIQE